jgi:methyl-accepting chemotaxis protein
VDSSSTKTSRAPRARRSSTPSAAARWRILAANVAAILFDGLLGFLTFQRIVKPIQALDASVRAIASGEYGKEVPFTRATDETGGLARSVDVLKQGAARWTNSAG